MYAIFFDVKSEHIENYGDIWCKAYIEIRRELSEFGFEMIKDFFFVDQSSENNLADVYKAINKLSSIDWFKKSVRFIRVFKIEEWSDFTDIVKN